MYHLPAYVALQRWAAGRTVVVVAPQDLDGVKRLKAAGARRVIVVGEDVPPDPDVDQVAATTDIPLDGRVELVVCIEGYPQLGAAARRRLADEARRLLSAQGVFAVWAPAQAEADGVDFWTLEDELSTNFAQLFMVAELPWRGVSWAPVLDDDAAAAVELALDEALLDRAPTVEHYLAIACKSEASPDMVRAFTGSCLLVPLPGAEETESRAASSETSAPEVDGQLQAELEQARRELDEARQTLKAERASGQAAAQQAKARANDVQVLSTTVADLEQTIERSRSRVEQLEQQAAEHLRARNELGARAQQLEERSEGLSHQLEVAVAEREGARQRLDRVEAELEQARRRLAEKEDQIQTRIAEATRLQSEVEVLRAKLEHHEALLAQSQSREKELSASAEQGRILTEVAQDRDRLREELGRRARRIQELEDKLWAAREDVQKERLENVRLSGEIERLREHGERSVAAEKARAAEVERLSGELHRLEVERADLTATLRTRDEELSRLRTEADALAGESEDLQALRQELGRRSEELSALGREIELTRAREQEATALAKKRQVQLDEAGTELERLRKAVAEHASTSATLHSELDVKALEVEQLSTTVSQLMAQLESHRSEVQGAGTRETELQRDLERQAAEQEALRRRLREREQELEDVLGARESNGVELYKLRRELEEASRANERLEQALGWFDADSDDPPEVAEEWPDEAVQVIRRLRAELASRPAVPVEAPDAEQTPSLDRARIRRLQLEIEVRAQEQEELLSRLDAAEQKIWEMNDAASRDAARLAAGLAQLEKNREQLDETVEELEVTRKLLASAQARALEQERLLASERAKLARRGIEAGSTDGPSDADVDDVFAELEVGNTQMVDLQPNRFPRPVDSAPTSEPATPTVIDVRDESSGILEVRPPARVMVEAIEQDDWPDDPAAGRSEQETVPRARVPKPPTTGNVGGSGGAS